MADFIGINNLIDGTVCALDAGKNGLGADTALGKLGVLANEQLKVGDRCVVCVRPENIALDAAEVAGGHNRVRGRIAFAAYLATRSATTWTSGRPSRSRPTCAIPGTTRSCQ